MKTDVTIFLGSQDFLVYREGGGGTVEIFDISVTSEHRRRGIGKQLLTTLFQDVGPGKRVFAITRTTNEVAQQFYESCGFEVAGVLRRFYGAENGADAVMYVRSSGGPL